MNSQRAVESWRYCGLSNGKRQGAGRVQSKVDLGDLDAGLKQVFGAKQNIFFVGR